MCDKLAAFFSLNPSKQPNYEQKVDTYPGAAVVISGAFPGQTAIVLLLT
jgi:hypothetical protein